MVYDIILKQGTVIDPAQGVHDVHDIGIIHGKISGLATEIPSNKAKKVIDVQGMIVTPGLIDLKAGMTPLQAVINAGGFKETAMPEGAIVIRKDKDNQPIPVRVNLKDALYGNSTGFDIQLQSYDVVYVPMSAIAEANKFVKQYIQDLLLFRGVSLGFSYELHADDPD